jgi:hypothetical protein
MKKHTFDPLSFIAGAIFLLIAGGSVLNTDLDYRLSEWFLPASILVLGVGLLVGSLRGMRSKDSGQKTKDDRPQTTDTGQEAESAGDTIVE